MAHIAKKLTKKKQQIVAKLVPGKIYDFIEAVELLQTLPMAKFKTTVESLDLSLRLGVDSKKSDQVVRGHTVLPNGTGKTVRIAVFAKGQNAELAKAQGVDDVGMEDLAERMKGGELNYDVVIATPDAMGVVGKLGPILGPRNLMPNPKVGTVAADIVTAIKNAKGGQVMYRTDKAGIIHCSIGKINFTAHQLKQNIEAVLQDLKKLKPANAKGEYIKKMNISTTMGPGLPVDLASLSY